MTVTRGSIPSLLVPAAVAEFVGISYGETPKEHKVLFEIVQSTRAFEEEKMISGMGGAPVKAEGSAVMFDDIQETYTARYQAENIATGFSVTKEAFDDDQYDVIARVKSQELGRAMADTVEVKGAAIYNNGFSSSYLGGDGVALFSTAHPTTVGSFSNKASVDLSESALEDACIAISKFTNDRGILIAASAKSLHIAPENLFVAEKILKSDLSTTLSSANYAKNDLNALKSKGIFPGGVHVNHRFTDPDAWFIRTSVANGAKKYERQKLMMGDHVDPLTGNMMFIANERYSFGWTDPRGLYGSEGA